MKLIYAFILSLFVQAAMFAQKTSNLIIFAEAPTPFYAIVNGVKQNNDPQTNVKITGLTNPSTHVKIVFADGTTPDIDKTLYFEKMNVEVTTKISNTKKGYKLRYFGEVDMGQAPIDNNQTVINYSPTPLSGQTTTTTNVTVPSTTSTTVVTEETTTTTSSNSNVNGLNTNVNVNDKNVGNSENVNVNMNVGGFGVNMDVNVNDNGASTNTSMTGNGTNTNSLNTSSSTSTTTTTTTTTSGYSNIDTESDAIDQVEYVPGYTGAVGCAIPQSSVNDIANAIDNEDFSDNKLMVAKQATKNKCLTTDQVISLLDHFDFEDKKLEFAKFAYDYTYDKDNYYKVNQAFDFSSSKQELNKHISNK